MCGIYGTTIKYSESQVIDKLKRTAFRGPDQMGVKKINTDNDNFVTFGHNRLSIIDLDPRSNQPFSYNDTVHLVFNGEIFNFQELKRTLQKLGYIFNTTSDTEVICAAYLEYGENCVSHFNGMFAFVIYDVKNQLLFGARDRLGQKPFYYYHNGKDFEFASQLSSIQLHHENLTISSKSINYFLEWGVVPDPHSIFNEISKLKAGYCFNFNLNTGELNKRQYWDIDFDAKTKFTGSFQDAKVQLDELLSDAVKIRLFADVPVGVFLSGGVDSSLITALATKTSSTKAKTFSVKFNEKGFDESQFAQQVAEHLQTDHHVIECNYKEGIDLIQNFSHYYDEPFADASAIPSMLLSKYTRQHVTVALSGDAGDENFIGYHRYNWVRYMSQIYKLPKPIRLLAASTLNIIPHYKLKTIGRVINNSSLNNAYLSTMYGSAPTWIKNDFSYHSDFDELKYLFHNSKNIYERISDFDIKTYLNWEINTKVDRASMAYSLEVRAPLQDYRIVKFARSLPTDYKYHNGTMKYILKELLYDYVPKHIFDRPKSGFTMPFKEWFKKDLKEFVLDELNDDALKSIPSIDVGKVKFMIKQHMDGSWNRYPLIWKLLVLKQWLNNNGKGLEIV
jgi:asparagine synthase (glutamine-hydrolysing)